MIFVYGDIGDMAVQRGGEEWIAGAINSLGYVMEKRPLGTRGADRFLPGQALKVLRELHDGIPIIDEKGVNFVEQALEEDDEPRDSDWEQKPDPETALKIAEDWLLYCVSGSDGEAWHRAWYEHTGDCEAPTCKDFNSNDLWCYEALRWFVKARAK